MNYFNGRPVGGENHPTAKLSAVERALIGEAKGQGVPTKSLAKIWDVSESTIRDVLRQERAAARGGV